jgi:hypothetical protein
MTGNADAAKSEKTGQKPDDRPTMDRPFWPVWWCIFRALYMSTRGVIARAVPKGMERFLCGKNEELLEERGV